MNASQWGYATPTREELLLVNTDWKNFTQIAKDHPTEKIFEWLNEFYVKCDDWVSQHGGLPIKYLGDASLSVFKAKDAETGILKMVEFTEMINQWFQSLSLPAQLATNIHFAEAVIGPMGSTHFQKVDVIGHAVNLVFTMSRTGISLTPQAFRQLHPDHRKRFKKFTPPIIYKG